MKVEVDVGIGVRVGVQVGIRVAVEVGVPVGIGVQVGTGVAVSVDVAACDVGLDMATTSGNGSGVTSISDATMTMPTLYVMITTRPSKAKMVHCRRVILLPLRVIKPFRF